MRKFIIVLFACAVTFAVGAQTKEIRVLLANHPYGDLLKAAETAGFSLFVTAHQNIVYQQNMKGRHIALVVLLTNHWATLRASASNIIQAVERIGDAGYEFVECGLPLRVRRTPPTLKL